MSKLKLYNGKSHLNWAVSPYILHSFTTVNSRDTHGVSKCCWMFSSVQFCCSVVSDSSRPHELQHARPPCPSPTPGVYPDSYPLSQWCHPTISSSVIPFSSCPQSVPASGSFPMSQLLASDGQSIGVSASTSVLPIDLLAVQGTLKSLLLHHSSNSLALSFLCSLTLTFIHDYWKNHSLD